MWGVYIISPCIFASHTNTHTRTNTSTKPRTHTYTHTNFRGRHTFHEGQTKYILIVLQGKKRFVPFSVEDCAVVLVVRLKHPLNKSSTLSHLRLQPVRLSRPALISETSWIWQPRVGRFHGSRYTDIHNGCRERRLEGRRHHKVVRMVLVKRRPGGLL